MNRQGCLYPFFAIFALAGLACGFWGLSGVISRQRLLNEGIKTTGTVIDLDRDSKGNVAPIIGFQDQKGLQVVYHSNFYSNMVDYEIGQKLPLWYLPSDPTTEVTFNETDWTLYFPFIFLFTHGGVGIGGLIWLERKRRLHKWLKEQGQEVSARFTKMDTHRGKSTSYSILCEWNDPYTGTVHEFRSEYLSSNPEAMLPPPGSMVRVLIDPANPKRYWVDTAFLDT